MKYEIRKLCESDSFRSTRKILFGFQVAKMNDLVQLRKENNFDLIG